VQQLFSDNPELVTGLLAALLLAVGWLLVSGRQRTAELRERLFETEQSRRHAEQQFEVADAARQQAETAHAAQDSARQQAETARAVQDEAVRRLEAETKDQRGRFDELTRRLEDSREATAARDKELERLKERLQREAESYNLRIAELTSVRDEMTKEFKLLADGVLKEHGKTLKEQNLELLNPLRQRIVEFHTGMTDAQKQAAEGRARLAEQIRHLSEHSTKMTAETVNLTRALKGDSQVRGAWGEMVLSRILEASGLREGEEFVTQESETLEEGGRLRPDAVVNLPGGRRLVVDSKVSLVAYEQFANAENDEERSARLRDHVAAVKTHIKQLSEKDYTRITGITPDYVIMFVPIEGAFAAALEGEPDLTETALRQNITLAAPTTLITILRSVSHLWQVDRQQKNAEEIASRAGLLYDKFEGFVSDMGAIETHLGRAQKAHGDAMNKLATGRGNLVSQTEDLRRLGAKAKKRLPDELVEDAGQVMIEAADD
jgi:DNA recombination protein RmuC